MSGKYDDMIHLPHPVSQRHAQMSRLDRAAQFSPFAALTGYEEAIAETARLTDAPIELDESSVQLVDQQLRLIRDHLQQQPMVTVTYFVPDTRKQGGSYQTVTARVRKLDAHQQTLELCYGPVIDFDKIISIELTKN